MLREGPWASSQTHVAPVAWASEGPSLPSLSLRGINSTKDITSSIWLLSLDRTVLTPLLWIGNSSSHPKPLNSWHGWCLLDELAANCWLPTAKAEPYAFFPASVLLYTVPQTPHPHAHLSGISDRRRVPSGLESTSRTRTAQRWGVSSMDPDLIRS